METTFTEIPLANKSTKIKINIELSSEINISPFVARQKANVFLLTHLGNLLWADEPKLSIVDQRVLWKIPVMYTIPKHTIKQVAELAMDVNTGEIILNESTPENIEEIEDHVEHIYQTYLKSTSL